jgi:hypothetical protein
MAPEDNGEHRRIIRSALELDEVESAVVFVRRPGSSVLELSAAEGISGPALEGLASAVANPNHPITRALADEQATYDVTPTAPGGPSLRSHLPLINDPGAGREAIGVLAVAHDRSLSAESRQALETLARLT